MSIRDRIGAASAGLAAVIGLAASAVLLVDSVAATPAFCAEGGCDELIASLRRAAT